MDDGAVIREVDRAQAEAVLCIRLFVPGVTEGGEDRYYLARTSPWRKRVVESVTRNPDGSVTTISRCMHVRNLGRLLRVRRRPDCGWAGLWVWQACVHCRPVSR